MIEEIGFNPEMYTMPTNPDWHNAPGVANTLAVVTFAAVPGRRHVIYKILWAYNAVPTGGQVRVFSGGQPLTLPYYITAGGPGFILTQVVGIMNQNLSIQLAAAGAAVTGAVGVEKHWTKV